MAKESKGSVRKVFITGLVVLVPVAVTGAVLVFLFNLLDNWLAPVVHRGLALAGIGLPAGWTRIPGLGILATVLLVFGAGLVGSNYLGRRVFRFGQNLLQSIPLVKNVYGGVSQLVETLSSAEAAAFRTPVMLEFPQPGIWTLAFVCGPSAEPANQAAGEELVNVFVPAAPIPTQGLFIMVPRRSLRNLPMTSEEAFTTIATLGMVRQSERDETPLPRSPKTI